MLWNVSTSSNRSGELFFHLVSFSVIVWYRQHIPQKQWTKKKKEANAHTHTQHKTHRATWKITNFKAKKWTQKINFSFFSPRRCCCCYYYYSTEFIKCNRVNCMHSIVEKTKTGKQFTKVINVWLLDASIQKKKKNTQQTNKK